MADVKSVGQQKVQLVQTEQVGQQKSAEVVKQAPGVCPVGRTMRFIIILIGLLMCGSNLVSDQQINKIELKELEEFIAQRAMSGLKSSEGTVLAHVKNDFNTKDTPFRIWKYKAGELKAGTMNDFKGATGDKPSEWPPFLYLFALKCVSSDAAQVEAWVIYESGGYKETWGLTRKDQQWSIIKKEVTVQY